MRSSSSRIYFREEIGVLGVRFFVLLLSLHFGDPDVIKSNLSLKHTKLVSTVFSTPKYQSRFSGFLRVFFL